MKKQIIADVFLIVMFMVLIWCFVIAYNIFTEYLGIAKIYSESRPELSSEYIAYAVEYGFLVFFNAIAILGFPFLFIYCNPKLFRRSTWTNLSDEWAKNKEERIAAKKLKSESDKQKRIEELRKELDELQDTNSNP